MKNKGKDIVWFVICLIVLFVCVMFYNWVFIDMRNELNAKNALLEHTQKELNSVTENLQLEYTKSEKLAAQLDHVTKSLDNVNETILALKNTEYELIYMGTFKLTHYCTEVYKHICGTGTGITSTGTQVTAGRTIAVDPTVIPYGSKVYIEGYGWRTAEDCGGAVKNKQIDIAVETHSDALSMGVSVGGVWILVEKGT